MPEYHNDTRDPVTLDWCVDPDHFDANGTHSGTECMIKTHIIPPRAVLSFSEDRNKTHIIESCQVEGLKDRAATKEIPA